MKKPKITEGKWSHVSNHVCAGKIGIIAECRGLINHQSKFIDEANAKAMSAVPEMIDIGIRILHKLQSETQSVTAKDQWDLEKALKKAGCIDE